MLCLPEPQLKQAIPSGNPVSALKDHAVSCKSCFCFGLQENYVAFKNLRKILKLLYFRIFSFLILGASRINFCVMLCLLFQDSACCYIIFYVCVVYYAIISSYFKAQKNCTVFLIVTV